MILLAGSALLMAKPSGTMDQSLKHLNEVPYYCSMKSTLQVTKSSAFSQSLKEKEFFSRKLAESLPFKEGFQVFATANTKGKGSDDGRFIGTNVLNEAFLERFCITLEQEYPSAAVETRILNKLCDDTLFCKRLADWKLTSSVRLSRRVVLMRLSAPVDWFTSSMLTTSLKIKQRQSILV